MTELFSRLFKKKESSILGILGLYFIILCVYCIFHVIFSMDFIGPMVIFGSFVSIWLLFSYNRPDGERESKKRLFYILALIVLNGTIIRLYLAYMLYGNYDMESFEILADIFMRGGRNVYAETSRYNYSPLWFMILGALKTINFSFPSLPFHFVQRSFMCGVDLATLLFLVLIARIRNISPVKVGLFFYLNPVSFLLTGQHGQFENLALLMVMIGIFAYFRLEKTPFLRGALLWAFSTLGMVIKQNIFYETIICLKFVHRRYWARLGLFAVSVLIFLLTFMPYWADGRKGIIDNVFLYSSGEGIYGVTRLFYFPQMKFLFLLGLFLFSFFIKRGDIIKQCLLAALFFLIFTTGMAVQYFILPIALGALCPSKGFKFYSLLATLFILGCFYNLNIKLFWFFFRWNYVWLGAIYWFITEQYEIRLRRTP